MKRKKSEHQHTVDVDALGPKTVRDILYDL